jgi:SAM-dependent methyltransferase
VLELGPTPLANDFVGAGEVDEPQELFPLDISLCCACGHVQLLDVVDPARLFRDYIYVSSTSSSFVDHFRRYADFIIDELGIAPRSRVIEIGSNDGTLLSFFKDRGMDVLGIDPAEEIAREATAKGIETLNEFFTSELATELASNGWNASAVLANNVFAHIDDLHDVVEGIKRLLGREGVFIFEVSYLAEVLEKTLFDTMYHEHLSYHSVAPLVGFFELHGMQLVGVELVDTHGGSLRGFARLKDATGAIPRRLAANVGNFVEHERRLGLYDPTTYVEYSSRIQKLKDHLTSLVGDLKRAGKRIGGYGAPAKATTFMYHFGIDEQVIDCIVDDSPLKQGLFSPGRHIPVVPSSIMYDETRPDYMLILAWNFAESIISNHQRFVDEGGHFIIPLPQLEVR